MEAYLMEELLPVVADLTRRYTAGDSTSVTYERAEYLMEAVLYCIHECDTPYAISGGKRLSAGEAYALGLEKIKEKVARSKQQYQKLMESFCAYGNRNYEDTVIKAIPGFFARYDVYFAPQENIITMDYPVLKRMEHLCGINAIETYISCICLEQQFLAWFNPRDVLRILGKFQKDYTQHFYNICRIISRDTFGKMLFAENRDALEMLFAGNHKEQVKEKLNTLVDLFVTKHFSEERGLAVYLKSDTNDFVTELFFYWQNVQKTVR